MEPGDPVPLTNRLKSATQSIGFWCVRWFRTGSGEWTPVAGADTTTINFTAEQTAQYRAVFRNTIDGAEYTTASGTAAVTVLPAEETPGGQVPGGQTPGGESPGGESPPGESTPGPNPDGGDRDESPNGSLPATGADPVSYTHLRAHET